MAEKVEFLEPSGEAPAGYHIFKRSHSPYERYMDEEGIPIFRGIGVRDTRDLTLGNWERLGGRGAFLYLDGIEAQKGMFVVEVPAGGALNAEKHIYDEFFLVIEGRGTTEIWQEGGKKQVFEWQPGTLFVAPFNAWHRLVNATGSPALLVAANNAPPIMNIFQSRGAVFENTHFYKNRYDGSDDYFKAKTDLEADEVRGRAAIRSNVFPDIVNCELPLDNQRAPGYRRIQPYFNGFISDTTTGGFVAQYPSGRYSKAHYHNSGAVLVCLKGKGYTLNWPTSLGPTPWRDGHGDQVNKTEYVPGGLVAAAPGGGSWFHQHFSIAKEPLRIINYWGGPDGHWGPAKVQKVLGNTVVADVPKDEDDDGEMIRSGNIFGINQGGRSILYEEEDPYVREYYESRLREEGVEPAAPAASRG
jgi:quercetin dioxygenase-like cupin family protein